MCLFLGHIACKKKVLYYYYFRQSCDDIECDKVKATKKIIINTKHTHLNTVNYDILNIQYGKLNTVKY